jgi:hypothetical protein
VGGGGGNEEGEKERGEKNEGVGLRREREFKFINIQFNVPDTKILNEIHIVATAVLRIRDDYPGSRILIFIHPESRIPDLTRATKEKGEKLVVLLSFLMPNFIELNIISFLNKCRKKLEPNDKELKYFLCKKIVFKAFKNMCWRSGTRKNPFRIQESKRHRTLIRIRNTGCQHGSKSFRRYCNESTDPPILDSTGKILYTKKLQ